MLRILLVAPISALITVAIFLGMYYMIRVDQPRLDPPGTIPQIVITAEIEEPRVIDDRDRPNRLPEPPEPVDIERERTSRPTAGVPTPRPGPVINLEPVIGRTNLTGNALITIPPTYPERCKGRGAQGVVIVEFDVNEIGDVINARILSSADSCFDQTVLRTIARWKFAPATRNGTPIVQKGLRRAFRFELE